MTSEGKKRKSPGVNLGLILFDEVDSLCPQCTKPLIKRTNGHYSKIYEVAHIYPHSPRPDEKILLQYEERLSDDPDHEDNLIALCRDCHKIFDNPRTILGYREMVAIKRELQRISRIKSGWFDNSLDSEIDEVVKCLVDFREGESKELSLEALTIESKLDSTMTIATKFKIQSYVTYFYHSIKDKFSELDKNEPYTSDAIYSQIRSYYLQLKKSGMSQPQIFTALTKWIEAVTDNTSHDVAEIIVSFFVQNCEVYS